MKFSGICAFILIILTNTSQVLYPMKRFLPVIFILLFCYSLSYGTHQRAAEIIYKHIDGLTYEVKIITYTRNNIANDSREYLPIHWGDGETKDLPRIVKTLIVSGEFDVVYNEYKGTHTYPGVGTYVLSMEDPNRNYGVVNIPNSVNVPIYVETELVINPFVGRNNSVQLLNEPIDHGCLNKKFVHNPGAFDIDGDSLSFELIKCRGTAGLIIPGYVFPNEVVPDPANSFTINPQTGDVIWDVPNHNGEYNFAILISEWRNGVKIGSVVRDMQVIIVPCDLNPPIFNPIQDTCVEAGQTLTFEVGASSPDGDIVRITASGGPFEMGVNPAYIEPDPGVGDSLATTSFTWNTHCQHVRKTPYQVYFKASVEGFPINLVDYKTVHVTVVAPAPENLTALPLGNSINLAWDISPCENATGYKIYRRKGYYGFIHGYCETGVPAYTGYMFLDEITGINNTSYNDNNQGQGLISGINYCYMVTAIFDDGAESYASLEACAALKRDLPVITNVSNDSASNLNGNIYLAWSKPVDLDTLVNPGPYQYKVYRAESFTGQDFIQIGTLYGLHDTLFFDYGVNINTSGIPYRYRIDLFSETIGDIGPSATASSLFLKTYGTDEKIILSWESNVPWLNNLYVIYRENKQTGDWDSIGASHTWHYSDTGLTNGTSYCYYVKSIGSYTTPGIFDPLVNYSQKTCGIPVDNIPPCPPEIINVSTDCETVSNEVQIRVFPADTCNRDVDRVLLYFSSHDDDEFVLIHADTGVTQGIITYNHNDLITVIGCYAARAVDENGNSSALGNIVCVDTLCGFRLPNAFTPNGDNWNDYFVAYPGSYGTVARVELVILNRWGRKVYETNDIVEWDGYNKYTNKSCAEGVYFYVGDVFEIVGDNLIKRRITGSVTLLR